MKKSKFWVKLIMQYAFGLIIFSIIAFLTQEIVTAILFNSLIAPTMWIYPGNIRNVYCRTCTVVRSRIYSTACHNFTINTLA